MRGRRGRRRPRSRRWWLPVAIPSLADEAAPPAAPPDVAASGRCPACRATVRRSAGDADVAPGPGQDRRAAIGRARVGRTDDALQLDRASLHDGLDRDPRTGLADDDQRAAPTTISARQRSPSLRTSSMRPATATSRQVCAALSGPRTRSGAGTFPEPSRSIDSARSRGAPYASPPGQPGGCGCRPPAPGRPSEAGPRSRRFRPRRRSGGPSRPGADAGAVTTAPMTTSRSVIRSAAAIEMALPSAGAPVVGRGDVPAVGLAERGRRWGRWRRRTAPRGGRGRRRRAATRGTRRARPCGTLAGRRRRSRDRSPLGHARRGDAARGIGHRRERGSRRPFRARTRCRRWSPSWASRRPCRSGRPADLRSPRRARASRRRSQPARRRNPARPRPRRRPGGSRAGRTDRRACRGSRAARRARAPDAVGKLHHDPAARVRDREQCRRSEPAGLGGHDAADRHGRADGPGPSAGDA